MTMSSSKILKPFILCILIHYFPVCLFRQIPVLKLPILDLADVPLPYILRIRIFIFFDKCLKVGVGYVTDMHPDKYLPSSGARVIVTPKSCDASLLCQRYNHSNVSWLFLLCYIVTSDYKSHKLPKETDADFLFLVTLSDKFCWNTYLSDAAKNRLLKQLVWFRIMDTYWHIVWKAEGQTSQQMSGPPPSLQLSQLSWLCPFPGRL